jgi:hypothetical protein
VHGLIAVLASSTTRVGSDTEDGASDEEPSSNRDWARPRHPFARLPHRSESRPRQHAQAKSGDTLAWMTRSASTLMRISRRRAIRSPDVRIQALEVSPPIVGI